MPTFSSAVKWATRPSCRRRRGRRSRGRPGNRPALRFVEIDRVVLAHRRHHRRQTSPKGVILSLLLCKYPSCLPNANSLCNAETAFGTSLLRERDKRCWCESQSSAKSRPRPGAAPCDPRHHTWDAVHPGADCGDFGQPARHRVWPTEFRKTAFMRPSRLSFHDKGDAVGRDINHVRADAGLARASKSWTAAWARLAGGETTAWQRSTMWAIPVTGRSSASASMGHGGRRRTPSVPGASDVVCLMLDGDLPFMAISTARGWMILGPRGPARPPPGTSPAEGDGLGQQAWDLRS